MDWKLIAEFGIAGVLCYLIFCGLQSFERLTQAYERLANLLASVVGNNTEAMTKVAVCVDQIADSLSAHDKRAEEIQVTARRTDETATRIEAKLDRYVESRAK